MGNDGIGSLHNSRIVPALVEHPDINPKELCLEDHTLCGTLVRCNEHQVITVDFQIFVFRQKCLSKLERGRNGFQAAQRRNILHSGIMGIKGDDAVNIHRFQFPQHHRAVKGFPRRLPVLPSFIQERHNHRDPFGLAIAGRDNPLQILIMIIR